MELEEAFQRHYGKQGEIMQFETLCMGRDNWRGKIRYGNDIEYLCHTMDAVIFTKRDLSEVDHRCYTYHTEKEVIDLFKLYISQEKIRRDETAQYALLGHVFSLAEDEITLVKMTE